MEQEEEEDGEDRGAGSSSLPLTWQGSVWGSSRLCRIPGWPRFPPLGVKALGVGGIQAGFGRDRRATCGQATHSFTFDEAEGVFSGHKPAAVHAPEKGDHSLQYGC